MPTREYFPITCPTHGFLAEPRGKTSMVWCRQCKEWYDIDGKVDGRTRKKQG